MKNLNDSKKSHALISAVGIMAAAALLGGAVWAEKDTSQINVKTGSSIQKISPSDSTIQKAAPSDQNSAEPVSPFRDLVRLQREMEQVFNDQPSVWSSFPWDRAFQNDAFLDQPDMDLHEQPDTYLVKVDLPGMDKSGINVEVKDNVLTVSAENRQTTEKKDNEKVLMKERSVGYVSRSVMLPKAVDETNVTAEYKNGVLSITLPKLEKDKSSRHIEIK